MRSDRDVIEGSQMREQVKPLKHHPDALALACRRDGRIRHEVSVAHVSGHVDPVHEDLAGRRHLDAIDATQQRRLAGAAWPDHHYDLAGNDIQIHPVEHRNFVENLRQPTNAQKRRVGHASRFSTYSENFARIEMMIR